MGDNKPHVSTKQVCLTLDALYPMWVGGLQSGHIQDGRLSLIGPDRQYLNHCQQCKQWPFFFFLENQA